MRPFTKSAVAVAAALSVWLASMPAQAASLGRLQVLSAAGQPLLAEIEVDGLAPDDLASLKAGVADPSAFKAAQLEASPLLSRLRFDVVRGLTDDKATIRITSPEPVAARNLDALIELSWSSGKVVREYTLSTARPDADTKPVELPSAAPLAAAGDAQSGGAAASANRVQSVASPLAKDAADAVTNAARKNASAAGRVVARGESLAQIAKEVAPSPAAVNSAMAAIFEKNRSAFIGNSIHLLREGALLDIPEEQALTSRNSKAALQMLAEFDDRADPYFQRMATNPAPVRKPSRSEDASTGSIGKVEADKPAPKSEDQLKVSRSRKDDKSAEAASNAQAEELLMKEKALREANDRIAALEKNIADMQRLMELKAAAGKAESAPGSAAPADKVAGKPEDKTADKATDKPADGATVDAAKAGDAADKAGTPTETALKPEEPADADKAKAEAALADEHEEDEHDKKPKPWYKNGLILAGAGGAVVLGGGAAGFLFYRRRKQQAAGEDAAPAVMADALADPTADLLNADVADEPAHAEADADLAGIDAGSALEDAGEAGELGELGGAAAGADETAGAAALGDALGDDLGALGSDNTSELGAGLLGGDQTPSGEAAELSAAAVDLDFNAAADTGGAAREPLLPPEMSAGDPPKPVASGNFADELDALSSQVGEASASIAALTQEASASDALDDDFGAVGGADGGDEGGALDEDEAPRQPPQRLSDTLAAIDLDLPGAGDPLPADPFADAGAESVNESPGGLLGGDSDFAAAADAAGDDANASATNKDDLARWQEMETKLDLAAAYIEIGDAESARDLLVEVLKKGDAAQNTRAAELMTRAV